MNGEAEVVNILIAHGGYVHAVDMVNKYVYMFSLDSSMILIIPQ